MIPTAQKVMVKTREQMGNIRLPIAQVTLVIFMLLFFFATSSSSDCTFSTSTRGSGTIWNVLGRLNTSWRVCRTTSRKGMVIVKSIHMSIILMYEVTGRLWERPRKLKGDENISK